MTTNKLIEIGQEMPTDASFAKWNREGATVVIGGVERAEDLIPFLLKHRQYPKIVLEVVNAPPPATFEGRLVKVVTQYDERLARHRQPKNYSRGASAASEASRKAAQERLKKMKPLIERAIGRVGDHNGQIAQWLNDQKLKTPQGKEWQAHNVQFLRSKIREMFGGEEGES